MSVVSILKSGHVTSQNSYANSCQLQYYLRCNGCEAIQFDIMNTQLSAFGSFTRSRSHVENKLIWMSKMYIWSQKLGRVCYGITLAISCLPTWSSGTMPKCCSAVCYATKQHPLQAWKQCCLHSLNAFHHISSNANGLSMTAAVIVLEVTR